MTDKDLPFLDDEQPIAEPETAEAVEETPAEPETVEAEPEVAEAAPVEEPETEIEVETGEETPETPPVSADKKPDFTPIQALLDEREKRQRLEQQQAELQRRLDAYEREKNKEPAPDFFEDPAAAAQYQQNTILQQVNAQKAQQSKFFAEREFGAEKVAEATAYFSQSPELMQISHQLMNEPSPFHAAVEFMERQKAVQEIGPDPEAYKEKLREEIRQEMLGQAQTRQTPSTKAPPPSMAKAPSAGKGDGINTVNTFDEMFNG